MYVDIVISNVFNLNKHFFFFFCFSLTVLDFFMCITRHFCGSYTFYRRFFIREHCTLAGSVPIPSAEGREWELTTDYWGNLLNDVFLSCLNIPLIGAFWESVNN